jgi:hypothetical protein
VDLAGTHEPILAGAFLAMAAICQSDPATLTLTGPPDTGLPQPAQASLNALIATTGALIEHGSVPDNAGLVVTFLALHEFQLRAITLLDEAEDRATRL